MTLFGIINVNKPQGLTSHDVVGKLRKILNMKQIGHTGTLDPMATGVLPVCIGKATKFIQYLDDTKAYRAFIKLGISTDTYDMEGKILEQKEIIPDMELVHNVLESFKGEITQIPPIYSAVHYKGKRLYEYARANIEIEEIPSRKVTINTINLIGIQEQNTPNPVLVVDIDCSAGTYIRTIAYDLGEKTGYKAVLSGLMRTKAGKFLIETSYNLEEIKDLALQDKKENFIQNPINYLNLKQIQINSLEIEKIKKGQYIKTTQENFNENEKIILLNQENFIAIAEYKEKNIYPCNVFI